MKTTITLLAIATAYAASAAPAADPSMVLYESVTRQKALERAMSDPSTSQVHLQADFEMWATRVAQVELSQPGSPCGKSLGLSLARWWAARRDGGTAAAAEPLQRLAAARKACAATLPKS